MLLLGMGGSSLGPEVLARIVGAPGAPRLHVLDSTDPAQVPPLERRRPRSTLVLVASKSGSTLEPNAFLRYFFDRLKRWWRRAEAGRHVVAITDPGSQIEGRRRPRLPHHRFR